MVKRPARVKRLVDGAWALTGRPGVDGQVWHISQPRHATLDAAHTAELVRLAHGIPRSEPEGPAFKELRRHNLVDDDASPEDPLVVERLRQLGHGYRWHARGCPDGDELTLLLRRMHSMRKLSNFDFGQTAVVPECGVARCWELQRRAGRNLRVLVIGDDDMLGPVLARMGHRVTVLDIDSELVDLLKRVADDEGLDLDVRHHDILEPLPADLRGACDAVLTDPMSYENCLLAFIGRGLQALRKGGSVFSCLHPLARNLFTRVVPRLPVHVEDVLNELSVYYFQGFVENWYRSDFYHLIHNGSDVPWPVDQRAPFDDIITGSLAERWHAFTDVRGTPLSRITVAHVSHALAQLERQVGSAAFTARAEHQDERWFHAWRALAQGGHLAATLDKQKGIASFDCYPHQPAWDAALITGLAQVTRLGGVHVFSAAPPDLNAPVIVTQPAPRRTVAPKKTRPRKRAAAPARRRRR